MNKQRQTIKKVNETLDFKAIGTDTLSGLNRLSHEKARIKNLLTVGLITDAEAIQIARRY